MKLTAGTKYQVVHRVSNRANAKDRYFVGVFLLNRGDGVSMWSLRPKLGTVGIEDRNIQSVSTVPDDEPIVWDKKIDRQELPF